MNDMDNRLSQLFQDEPIAQESLGAFHEGIMNQILMNPVNFQEEILRAERRKWGFVFLSILLTLGLGIFLILWFAKDWLVQTISPVVLWVGTSIPGFGALMEIGQGLLEKWMLLIQLKAGAETLWNQYAFSIVGILLVWVLFEGARSKTNFDGR